MNIKAIQTRYAGCHFRSRLEARWAVFFDALGIKWEYEPEGFEVGPRLTRTDTDVYPYLPDFWLPKQHLWVEVKGSLTVPELRKVLNTAAYMSSSSWGKEDGHPTLILGAVPRFARTPVQLEMAKGFLFAEPWMPMAPSRPTWHNRVEVAYDYYIDMQWLNDEHDDEIIALKEMIHEASNRRFSISSLLDLLLNGMPMSAPSSKYVRALERARSARFEHGERG